MGSILKAFSTNLVLHYLFILKAIDLHAGCQINQQWALYSKDLTQIRHYRHFQRGIKYKRNISKMRCTVHHTDNAKSYTKCFSSLLLTHFVQNFNTFVFNLGNFNIRWVNCSWKKWTHKLLHNLFLNRMLTPISCFTFPDSDQKRRSYNQKVNGDYYMWLTESCVLPVNVSLNCWYCQDWHSLYWSTVYKCRNICQRGSNTTKRRS